MLSWDKEILTFAPNDKESGQPEWQRKEKLYHQVKNFDIRFVACYSFQKKLKFNFRLLITLTKGNVGKKVSLYVKN